MKTVWKYEIKVLDAPVSIAMPASTQILKVEGQDHETLLVWALVETDNAPKTRNFLVAGTGHALPPVDLLHHGTVRYPGGLVWHLFEALS